MLPLHQGGMLIVDQHLKHCAIDIYKFRIASSFRGKEPGKDRYTTCHLLAVISMPKGGKELSFAHGRATSDVLLLCSLVELFVGQRI